MNGNRIYVIDCCIYKILLEQMLTYKKKFEIHSLFRFMCSKLFPRLRLLVDNCFIAYTTVRHYKHNFTKKVSKMRAT